MLGTPSACIAIAARTQVPPSVRRLLNREAKASTMSEEATNRSPPTPSLRNARRVRTKSRSLLMAIEVLSSAALMAYSEISPSITRGVPCDLVVDRSAQTEHELVSFMVAWPFLVERCFSGGVEQVDLLCCGDLHGRDARRLDGVGLAHSGVIGEDLAHLVVVGGP